MLRDTLLQAAQDVTGATMAKAVIKSEKPGPFEKVFDVAGSFIIAQCLPLVAQAIENSHTYGNTETLRRGAIAASAAEAILLPSKVVASVAAGILNPVLGVTVFEAFNAAEHHLGRAVQNISSRRFTTAAR